LSLPESTSKNGISIGSAVLAGFTTVMDTFRILDCRTQIFSAWPSCIHSVRTLRTTSYRPNNSAPCRRCTKRVNYEDYE